MVRSTSRAAVLLILAVVGFACNMQTGKSHYILAERLFNDKKYAAAVEEFNKIINEDPKGTLAQQSLFRIAVIQFLYMENYAEAAKNFKQFSSISQNTDLVFQAEKSIGEIYFAKLEIFPLAVEQYKKLLEKYPKSTDTEFFLLRMGKSYYGALDFDHAIEVFKILLTKYPKSPLASEALYQIGNTYFTKGECEEAIEQFQEVLLSYPKSSQAVYAQFGIGNCYEELEMPDQALKVYERILPKHPSKHVVEAKIRRLKEKSKKAF